MGYLGLEDLLERFTSDGIRNSLIGFEPAFKRLTSASLACNQSNGYPPYNLERVDDSTYRITLAVAGFTIGELDITVSDNKLVVTGQSNTNTNNENLRPQDYIYKGLAERDFKRSFVLADHVSVTNASLKNGLLAIDLKYEMPEALKPKSIQIN